MPTISTIHGLNNKNVEVMEAANTDINMLINNITFDILKNSPALVTEVENGRADKKALEIAIIQHIDRQKYNLGIERAEVIKKVMDYMFGYWLLQPYLDDDSISDIDGTGPNEWTIKRNGIRERIDIDFGSEKMFEAYCKVIAIRNGGILNENDTHCRVSDEKRRLRINLSIPPRNVKGAAISIRKHPKRAYTFDELIKLGMMNEEIALYLDNAAKTDNSILICGKGGSGKTTILRTVINNTREMERILIIESDVEIYPEKPFCIEQRVKKKNEGGIPVTLRDLAADGLTMSLDTYVTGELVGGEAWEFIIASFTGHRGMATLHTWDAAGALPRLLTLAKFAGITESEHTIKEMIGTSIDIIVYMKSFKVAEIIEVLGYDASKNDYIINPLYKFNITHEDKHGRIYGNYVEGRGGLIKKIK